MLKLDDPPVLSRREARRRDRRDAIMAVAQRSFLENGYAATTMSSIAATLGGSKGTLWSYFPSKEALFAAVLEQATKAYRDNLAHLLEPGGELASTLRTFTRALLQRVLRPDSLALYRLVVAEAARSPEMGAIFCELGPRYTRGLLGQFLQGAMKAGQLREADPDIAARTLVILAMSGCYQKVMLGQIDTATQEQIEADVVFAVDFFLRGYAPDR
ncbi:MAG TPA: TetR/AcrR family transcriptional regulator [Sphingobium sp.]|nr:TetR/AcrR family transcriptional regulator [Sphingobium sp.]